jgi:hypothetical protein
VNIGIFENMRELTIAVAIGTAAYLLIYPDQFHAIIEWIRDFF